MPTGGESLHLFPSRGQSEISLSFWRFTPVSAVKRSWELPVRQILDTLYFALTDAEAIWAAMAPSLRKFLGAGP
jgi:hypothetical protein